MRRVRAIEEPVPRTTVAWLIAGYVAAILPHALYLPPWVIPTGMMLAAWRGLGARRGWPLPRNLLRLLLAALGIAAIGASFHTLLGREPGVALVVLMLGLKLLETRRWRDVHVAVYLGYFLAGSYFLESQSLPLAFYTVLPVVLLTACLLNLHRRGTAPITAELRYTGLLLAQALPLALVLFMLFPRLNGPLWGLPADAHGAVSGLSDEMRPGDISHLSLSNAVAFRVDFHGPLPPRAALYWRGPVLSYTNGERWAVGLLPPGAPAATYTALGAPVRYTLTLEPHQRRWLYALDLPASTPPGTRINPDFQLLAAAPVRDRLRYELTSYPAYHTGELTPEERQRALQLPHAGNPRARQLAASWRAQHDGDDNGIVEAALAHYHKKDYTYTLRPPRMSGDVIDVFLFDSRRGFCEHYAASFVFLMRAAGVPARVVTGYQGGELNPVGDYLIVRQRDAHAWAEVWLRGRGWVRVDPTAAVAPGRIEFGMDDVALEAGAAGFFTRDASAFWTHGWDAIDNAWNQWVLSYDLERQRALLKNLGFNEDAEAFALALTLGIVPVLAALLWWTRVRRPASDPVVAAYQTFCAKLARRGLAPRSNEGPADYAARVIAARPELAPAIQNITTLYLALRYRGRASSAHLRRLQHLSRVFKA